MQLMHVNQDKLSMLFTVINNPFQNKHQISKKQMTFERVKKLVIPTDKIHWVYYLVHLYVHLTWKSLNFLMFFFFNPEFSLIISLENSSRFLPPDLKNV